jgi:hypothetical protein
MSTFVDCDRKNPDRRHAEPSQKGTKANPVTFEEGYEVAAEPRRNWLQEPRRLKEQKSENPIKVEVPKNSGDKRRDKLPDNPRLYWPWKRN